MLSAEDRAALERWSRRRKTAAGLARRSRIVLLAADGVPNREIATRVGCHLNTVRLWRGRFTASGVEGLLDEPRPGRPRVVGDDKVEEVVLRTLGESPPNGDTHWSNRTMARRSGVSRETVGRIWRAFGLKPHLSETFKLSTDPQFMEKVRDVVGLYLDPPEKAVVLCVDEKSQMQALDRTAPVLRLKAGGTPERRTHDDTQVTWASGLQNRRGDESPLAGSIPVRLRYQGTLGLARPRSEPFQAPPRSTRPVGGLARSDVRPPGEGPGSLLDPCRIPPADEIKPPPTAQRPAPGPKPLIGAGGGELVLEDPW
jgi:transposase